MNKVKQKIQIQLFTPSIVIKHLFLEFGKFYKARNIEEISFNVRANDSNGTKTS
jgi:hypothetical protein